MATLKSENRKRKNSSYVEDYPLTLASLRVRMIKIIKDNKKNEENLFKELAALFAEYGKTPHLLKEVFLSRHRNLSNNTLFIAATIHKNLNFMNFLVAQCKKYGLEADIPQFLKVSNSAKGFTPLHCAINADKDSMVELILSLGGYNTSRQKIIVKHQQEEETALDTAKRHSKKLNKNTNIKERRVKILTSLAPYASSADEVTEDASTTDEATENSSSDFEITEAETSNVDQPHKKSKIDDVKKSSSYKAIPHRNGLAKDVLYDLFIDDNDFDTLCQDLDNIFQAYSAEEISDAVQQKDESEEHTIFFHVTNQRDAEFQRKLFNWFLSTNQGALLGKLLGDDTILKEAERRQNEPLCREIRAYFTAKSPISSSLSREGFFAHNTKTEEKTRTSTLNTILTQTAEPGL